MPSTSQAPNKLKPSRNALMLGISVLFVLAFIEFAAFLTVRILRDMGVVYDPSAVTQDYADYLQKRDPDLGWSPASDSDSVTRDDPVFPASAPPCVSLFGDSFTWSSEVDDGDAWGSVLASKLRCRVANYGVPGYGSDQALLWFRSLRSESPIVFLNHVSENILRNVNQYRNLLYPGDEFALKPRFVSRDGALELVRLPDIKSDNVGDFLAHPDKYLEHEFFLPGQDTGIQPIRFPYSVTLIKALLSNYHIYAKLTGRPRHADFYLPGHASDGLAVTFGILRDFAQEAEKRGQQPIVTIIPTCADLQYFDRIGEFPYANLEKLIVSERIRFIDFGEEIAKRLKGSSPDGLYDYCSAHFNERGYRALADIAYDYLNADPDLRRLLKQEE